MAFGLKPEFFYGNAAARPEWSARIITSEGASMSGYTIIEWVLGASLVGIVLAVLYALWIDAQRPGFELKKADWECSASHQESTTTLVNMGGKTIVLMPITTTHTVCDQWQRRSK